MRFSALQLARCSAVAGTMMFTLRSAAWSQDLCAEVAFGRADARPFGLPSMEKLHAIDSIIAGEAALHRRLSALDRGGFIEGRSGEIRSVIDRLHVPVDTLAGAFAMIMGAEMAGFTSDQAAVAADLYHLWRLPTGPAARLLGAPATPMLERSFLLWAVTDRLESPDVRTALVQAMCGLTARWEGIAARADRSAESDVVSLLAGDERQFLFDVMLTLARADSSITSLHLERIPVRDAAIRHYLQSESGRHWH